MLSVALSPFTFPFSINPDLPLSLFFCIYVSLAIMLSPPSPRSPSRRPTSCHWPLALVCLGIDWLSLHVTGAPSSILTRFAHPRRCGQRVEAQRHAPDSTDITQQHTLQGTMTPPRSNRLTIESKIKKIVRLWSHWKRSNGLYSILSLLSMVPKCLE